tara:strand:- start:147 stop:836 length:690 start_codon:yes stop_codon:yes gene_type:complete
MLLGKDLVIALVSSFIAIGCFDVVCRLTIPDKNTRWYLTHAITNFVVVIFVIPDCIALLRDPAACLEAPSNSDIPLAITVALHIFHCVSQIKTLSVVDWMHHLFGNILVCALAFPFHYGPLLSWGTFFVCGAPGGLDYLLLFLVKTKYMNKIQEKEWNRVLNMWIRLPGILFFVPLAYSAYVEGRTSVPLPVLSMQGALNFTNAIYFADRVVANTAVAVYKEEEKIKKV